ncbi:YcnI family copper-binding membrane protein [Catenuloplanes japonicus]|uniref:YcnI family copper-binding membrane protein n=1 Tax=Catenuloplanes japonicus TaxID=33876 RepID=UPI000526CE74|nr:YcnI family protein [Catenuloplanes japonicus]
MSRTARAALLSLGASVAGVLALAGPASAHVTVNPREAVQGGYAKVDFRVPNESDTASTTKIEVFLPETSPIGSVSTQPVPGWEVAIEKGAPAVPVTAHGTQITEVVKKVTWTAAAGSEIKPGTFQEFGVSLGPLPETDQLVFKALQTYSDGEVVRWIDEPVAGGEEPESPAPVLTLTAAGAATDEGAEETSSEAAPASEGDSGPALGIAIAGLVAGLIGLVLGGLAYTRGGARPASAVPAASGAPAAAAAPASEPASDK